MPTGHKSPNAHEIVHHVRQLLIKGGASQYQVMEFTTKAFKGSYEDLIAHTKRWVTVIEV